MKTVIKSMMLLLLILGGAFAFAEANVTESNVSSSTDEVNFTGVDSNASSTENVLPNETIVNETLSESNVTDLNVTLEEEKPAITAFEASLLDYKVTQRMPKDTTVLIQFYEKESESITKNITLASITNDNLEPNITLTVPADYLDMSACDATKQIWEKKDIKYSTHMTFVQIFWKFRNFDDLRNCIFADD